MKSLGYKKFIKKLSMRQVASMTSLIVLALALPIGLALTKKVQDIRQQAYFTPSPISPPTLPSNCQETDPCPSGYILYTNLPSADEPDQCPTTYCWDDGALKSPQPITHDDIYLFDSQITLRNASNNQVDLNNLQPNSTISYEITAKLNNSVKTASLGNNFYVHVTAYHNGTKLQTVKTPYINLTNHESGTPPLTLSGELQITSENNTFTLVLDTYGSVADVNINNNTWTVSSSASKPPTSNVFDINNDNKVNIADYTLFITGFISSLNQ